MAKKTKYQRRQQKATEEANRQKDITNPEERWKEQDEGWLRKRVGRKPEKPSKREKHHRKAETEE